MNVLAELFGRNQAHLLTAALFALRLLPVTILCPFLGGPLAPSTVRICLAVGLGGAAYAAGGAEPLAIAGIADFLAAGARELFLGLALGFLASLPFEAARAGGRLADTLRGATLSEMHVPLLRQRETAIGDLLAQWLVVLAACAGGDKLVVRGILGTFASLPVGPGHSFAAASVAEAALRGSGELLSCALCLGAPAAAGVLAADLALSLVTKAAPGLAVGSAAQPARAALGLGAVALGSSALMGKLLSFVVFSTGLAGTIR